MVDIIDKFEEYSSELVYFMIGASGFLDNEIVYFRLKGTGRAM